MGGCQLQFRVYQKPPAEPLSHLLKSLRFSLQNFLYHIQLFMIRSFKQ